MTTAVSFFLFLLSTVALLSAVVVTGRRSQRVRHLSLVAITLASLGITIYFAEQLGDQYDLESAGIITPIHLTLAKITTVCYLLPVITGIMTIRDQRNRRRHRHIAVLVATLTVLTAITGLTMLLRSTPLEIPVEEAAQEFESDSRVPVAPGR